MFEEIITRVNRIVQNNIDSKKYNYRDLEKLTGIPKSSIYRYVHGQTQWGVSELSKFIKALGLEEDAYIMNFSYQAGPFETRIVRIMSERQVDIAELASGIGESEERMESIIYDPEAPEMDILKKIALYLQVDMDWLRGDTLVPLYYLDATEYQLIRNYRIASVDTQRAVQAILK